MILQYDTSGVMETVLDLVNTVWTLIVKVLLEDIFFEVIWSKGLVFIFVSLGTSWGFMLGICLFLWMFHRKYVAGG